MKWREKVLRCNNMIKIPGDEPAAPEQRDGVDFKILRANKSLIIGHPAADRLPDASSNALKRVEGYHLAAIFDDTHFHIFANRGDNAGEFWVKKGASQIGVRLLQLEPHANQVFAEAP